MMRPRRWGVMDTAGALAGAGAAIYRRARKYYTPPPRGGPSWSRYTNALMRVMALRGKVEVKRHNVAVSGGDAIPNSGTFVHLTHIDQDVTESTRVGLVAKALSVDVRGVVKINAAATATSCRLIVFIDHGMEGNNPSISQVLEQSSPQANRAIDDLNRFTLLFDRIVTLSASDKTHDFRFYQKFKIPKKMKWYDNDGGHFRQGQLWFLSIADEATNTPTHVTYATVRFIDA